MNASRRHALVTLAACAALLGLVHTAAAGLPMTCHPLYTGEAPLLPWGKDGWRSPDPGYEVRNLTRDTLRLLSADAPILARMENLRRATLYAMEEPAAADDLLRAMILRASAGPGNRLAWFDAAYLFETYRQAGGMDRRNPLSRVARPASSYEELNELDGYRMLGALLPGKGAAPDKDTAELEFARGLMMRDGTNGHLRRAAQLAPKDSALALNVANFLVK